MVCTSYYVTENLKKKILNSQAKSIEFFPINWPRNIWYVKDKLKINDNLTV